MNRDYIDHQHGALTTRTRCRQIVRETALKVVQRNGVFAHQENFLMGMLGDSDEETRILGVEKCIQFVKNRHYLLRPVIHYLLYASGVRSGHASHALHDQIFRDCITNCCALSKILLNSIKNITCSR